MTKKQAKQKELDYLNWLLTEKGYRECLAKMVTLSTEYFQAGGTFNCMDFEQKQFKPVMYRVIIPFIKPELRIPTMKTKWAKRTLR